MTTKVKIPLSKLLIGLVFSCIPVTLNIGIADQIALAKSTNPHKCDIFAYVTDPEGLNVRSGASTNNKILGQIPINETVQVIAAVRDWVKITNASDGFKGTGWVSLPRLGLTTRGYGTDSVDIYAHNNQKSRKAGRIPANTAVKLLGCQRDWAQVEYQGIKGWLKKQDQCGAALTSCS
ncbi:MAG: SH3 domain-containing protein [Nostoc sp. DedVER02]|uniref:SH3 domain-containing protein n=1 Tax=unclassified Nostoc TaxID=2593658 RepID=UPI002AD2B265|nr:MULTISPECIES: SH3 domain-containing protein [unclassified Nostoc]MDZ7989342.1 SH3 domain-containing protein [Nostoc sp. DedVER02]MDZ8114462.1 SH3 domain-containing protein [Nostoc sp. DedVER01b]